MPAMTGAKVQNYFEITTLIAVKRTFRHDESRDSIITIPALVLVLCVIIMPSLQGVVRQVSLLATVPFAVAIWSLPATALLARHAWQ